jgi:hypothetical protein
MATSDNPTLQYGIKQPTIGNIRDYALFLGGPNATHDALEQYDPLRTGYARLFMVRKPVFLQDNIPDKLAAFKHIVEYGNTSIQGIIDISMQFESMTGGYVGKPIEVPMASQDGMNTFTVTCYEFSGSPIRQVIETWINGTSDTLSGLQHYNGSNVPHLMANETAEFIYIATDQTGRNIEYACLLAGCFPETINLDAFQYTSGQHNLVTYDIVFHCIRYNSIQINALAQALLDHNQVLTNSLNFYSGIPSSAVTSEQNAKDISIDVNGRMYDVRTGKLKTYDGTTDARQPVNSAYDYVKNASRTVEGNNAVNSNYY